MYPVTDTSWEMARIGSGMNESLYYFNQVMALFAERDMNKPYPTPNSPGLDLSMPVDSANYLAPVNGENGADGGVVPTVC